MKNKIYKNILLATSIILAACGGGGGGGGSGSDARPGTGTRIIHASIHSAPVELFVAEEGPTPLAKARFGEVSNFAALGARPASVTLAAANRPGDVIYSNQVPFEKNDVKTILLFGDVQGGGVRASVIADPLITLSDGNCGVRVINAAENMRILGATIDGSSFADVGTFLGKASSYIQVAAGVHEIVLQNGNGGAAIIALQISCDAGKQYTITLGGHLGYFLKPILTVDN